MDSDNQKIAKEHKKIFTQQLRNCFHLYDQPAPQGSVVSASGEVLRYQEERLSEELANTGFEPAMYASKLFTPLLDPPFSVTSGVKWQQSDPWMLNDSPALTVGQVTASLGAVQMCPAPAACSLATCSSAADICSKTASYTLAPDIKSYIDFITGRALTTQDAVRCDSNSSVKPTSYPAYKAPGMFPLNSGINGSTMYPVSLPAYTNADNSKSHVMLVLHTLPDQTQLDYLRDRVTEMATGKIDSGGTLTEGTVRPVTVIYIPANASDASPSTITKLQTALTPRSTSAAGSALTTRVDPELFVVAPPRTGSGTFTDEDFQGYWHKMLTDDDEGAVALAQSIFYGRLLRVEQRY